MLRSQALRLANLEQGTSALFRKNNPKLLYKNTCQCVIISNFSSLTKQAVLTSNIEHDSGPENNKKLSDKEFLVKLKTDPDTFGSQTQWEALDDEGDIEEEKHFTEQTLPSQKLHIKQYSEIIKDLIRKRRIKEAIDVLEVRMLKEDKVKPEAYIYNLLLGACGRVGYTKKAFMLYNNMKRRGLPVMGGTYTALFNACANSPWPFTDGITRAKHLRKLMIEKGHNANDTTYNAMIKAFGRCGDLKTAFFLVDEMSSKGITVNADAITFLLQACITDKEAGFRHALLVWRKLVDKNIKPSLYNYNMFLRSIRDCGLGDIDTTQDVINKIISSTGEQILLKNEQKYLVSSNDADNMLTEISNLPPEKSVLNNDPDKQQNGSDEVDSVKNFKEELVTEINFKTNDLKPNLMATVPYLGSLISLSEVKRPEDRLLLVGGCKGFLVNMDEHKCKPDIKTITLLLDCIPGSLAAEQQLLTNLKKYALKLDIDFYNMLMKKRSMRCDYEGAKVVVEMMKMVGYRPNVMTYGILAMSCKTKEQCVELIDEMKEKKYAINAEILGAMLHQACFNNDIKYVLHVMDICLSENVNPNKMFIEKLDAFKKKVKGMYLEKDITEKQKKLFKKFKVVNKTWRDQVHIDESENAHPWQQYRQTQDGDVHHQSLKDTTRFKARHASLFKVKTSTKKRY